MNPTNTDPNQVNPAGGAPVLDPMATPAGDVNVVAAPSTGAPVSTVTSEPTAVIQEEPKVEESGNMPPTVPPVA